MHKIGELLLNIDSTHAYGECMVPLRFQVTLKFGKAELLVTAKDLHTGKNISCTLKMAHTQRY
jgi:hypothetical protein